MIKGIGLDIIELNRIEKGINHSERLINRILTDREREIYHSLPTFRRKVEFTAGRFAAKEAFSKAMGTGLGKLGFQDIEILSSPEGAPELTAASVMEDRVFVSISHSREYAAAQVIIETNSWMNN